MAKKWKYSVIILICFLSIIIAAKIIKSNSGFKEIENVSQSQKLYGKTNSKNVITAQLTIVGEVDGVFTLEHFHFGPGKVNEVMRTDWYDNQIEIRYQPKDVTKGHLKIKVELF